VSYQVDFFDHAVNSVLQAQRFLFGYQTFLQLCIMCCDVGGASVPVVLQCLDAAECKFETAHGNDLLPFLIDIQALFLRVIGFVCPE
jgi:hypothetical protein